MSFVKTKVVCPALGMTLIFFVWYPNAFIVRFVSLGGTDMGSPESPQNMPSIEILAFVFVFTNTRVRLVDDSPLLKSDKRSERTTALTRNNMINLKQESSCGMQRPFLV